MRTLALVCLGFLFLVYVFSGRSRSTPTAKAKHVPSGSPPVVVVTVFNSEHGLDYKNTIKENRINYAKLHGMRGRTGEGKRNRERDLLTSAHRVRNVLPAHRRLRPPRLAHVVDEGRGHAPRFHEVP